jgi:hypothetical protein
MTYHFRLQRQRTDVRARLVSVRLTDPDHAPGGNGTCGKFPPEGHT